WSRKGPRHGRSGSPTRRARGACSSSRGSRRVGSATGRCWTNWRRPATP
ncbi:MAG: hypothetical protein AVDCRST_MAG88-1022, partial [uncultured Thermomicrobiales bacterium]